MSTGLLYHAFGIRGYQYVSTRYENGEVIFQIRHRKSGLCCPKCRSRDVIRKGTPDWPYIHRKLRKKAVTLMLLWEEYKSVYPEGYQYSQFCHLYHQWKRQIDPVMRQDYRAGEVLFVDWAGMTIDIVDPVTGNRRPASIFVAAMGASSYTHAEATLGQELCDWLGAHSRAFATAAGLTRRSLFSSHSAAGSRSITT